MSATPSPPTQSTHSRHIARNTMLVAASFGLAAGAGLLRNIAIARYFNIGTGLDAYYAAFKLPDLLFTIVAGGALATAFIPVFADFVTAGDRRGAWRLAASITNLVVLVVATAATLAWIAAPWLVRVLVAPGFGPEQQAETAALMRLVLISTLLFGVSSVQSSALHGFKHFLLPALAPAVYPLGVTAGAIWLAPTLGVRGLAIGAVVGAALHLAIKVPALIHYGFQWWPVVDLRSRAVRRVLLLMGPRVLDLGVFHLTFVIMTNLASRLDAGSVSALEWGWDAVQLPETVIGTAFGLVAFPTLSELAARRDIAGLQHTLSETTRAVIALTLPAAAGLILMGRQILTFLYGGGAFDDTAISAIYVALQFFALGLVGHACLELAARAFFAQQDTVTPLIVAAAFGALNVVLALLLMGPIGHGGLALANSIAITIEVVALLAILRRRWGGVQGREISLTVARSLAATAVMSVAVAWALAAAESRDLPLILQLGVGAATGAAVYVPASLLLGERAIGYLPSALRRVRA